jgi:hypothetical protein
MKQPLALVLANNAFQNTKPSRGQFFSAAHQLRSTMANHSKVRTEAEAQFRKTLKATWKSTESK